jgi:hypothetical protein
MDTLPLPPRPNLTQYRKRAKDLVKASKSPNTDAIRAWAREWLESLAALLGYQITTFVQSSLDRAVGHIEEQVRAKVGAAADGLTLADAQFFIANAHSFASWAEFSNHLEQLRADRSGFEAAADAVVTGDLATLEGLLRRDPSLIRARSARVHRATLLHYVAANGVEDFRQKTPPNAVAIARLLLEAGAEVDALAETYGGGRDQTTMNLLVSSEHPARAGLHAELVDILLDFGAAINGLEDNESPIMTALAFGYAAAAEALVRRGARVDTIITAAALGRADLVSDLVVDGQSLRPGVPLPAPRWPAVSADVRAHIELGFLWACKFGRTAVVEVLLGKGVDPGVKDIDDMTGLHHATAGRHLDVVSLLLQHGAPLEVTNRWGGTVLDSTVYFARNANPNDEDYTPVIALLIAGGADVGAVWLPTGDARIDALLQGKGNT